MCQDSNMSHPANNEYSEHQADTPSLFKKWEHRWDSLQVLSTSATPIWLVPAHLKLETDGE
jgi:hypothetical protein